MTVVAAETSTGIGPAVPVLTTPEAALAAVDAIVPEIARTAVEREVSGSWPVAELELVAASGLLGISVPAVVGGPGLPLSVVVEVLRRLARADSAVAQLHLAHYVLIQGISGLGDREPARTIYADILAGARLGNATVERGTKTSRDRNTRVRKVGDDWVLDGKKYYATGTLGAAWIAVAAQIADTDPAHSATVFVRTTDPGVRLNLEAWSSFGQQGTASGEVVLDGVRVPDELVLDEGPAPDPVTAGPTILGAYDQALHAAIDIGIARAALEDGAEFVRTRSRPWFEAQVDSAAEEPHVVRRFGELTARLYALEALLRHGTELIDVAAAEELSLIHI